MFSAYPRIIKPLCLRSDRGMVLWSGRRHPPAGPGFKKVLFTPQSGGDFRWGRALLDTPHGFAMSHWNPIGKRLAIELTDPEGTNSTPDLSTSFQIENAISAGKIFYV